MLEQQVSAANLADRVVSVRANPFGSPLLNLKAHIVGPTGTNVNLISSWEVTDTHLRLVTAWAEVYRSNMEAN